MKDPCIHCERKETDFGGCRCQAFQLTGDAADTDPACSLSERHETLIEITQERPDPDRSWVYRILAAS